MHDFHPLRCKRPGEIGHAGGISAGAIEAGNKLRLDRIAGYLPAPGEVAGSALCH